jgi:hypothetical protein
MGGRSAATGQFVWVVNRAATRGRASLRARAGAVVRTSLQWSMNPLGRAIQPSWRIASRRTARARDPGRRCCARRSPWRSTGARDLVCACDRKCPMVLLKKRSRYGCGDVSKSSDSDAEQGPERSAALIREQTHARNTLDAPPQKGRTIDGRGAPHRSRPRAAG